MNRTALAWALCALICAAYGNWLAAWISGVVILYETRLFKPSPRRR